MKVDTRQKLLSGVTLIAGIRGSGKTSLAQQLLRDIAPHRLFIVEESGDWGGFTKKKLSTKLSAAQFYKTSHRTGFLQPWLLMKHLRLISQRGHFYIVLDDIDAMMQIVNAYGKGGTRTHSAQAQLTAMLNYLALMGRHENIGIMAISHRLRHLPQNMLSEAMRLEIFHIHHDDDLRRLRTIIPKEQAEYARDMLTGHKHMTIDVYHP